MGDRGSMIGCLKVVFRSITFVKGKMHGGLRNQENNALLNYCSIKWMFRYWLIGDDIISSII